MNTSRLNFTRLNTSVLNASLLNSSLMGGRGKGSSSRPNGLIAQYKPYLNSNDSPTRDVLKDYSGHGNDIVLYNFAFTEESGYNTTTYPGALVSDGVDDYGICEKFPILTKEKGYTVCALRKWLNKEKDQVFLCKTNNPNHGAFMFECYEGNEYRIYSYGQLTRVNEFPDLFSHQKTNQYNTTSISVGNYTDGSTLFLFRGRMDFPYYCEIALYALEIYDRDLSEEEIETVKQRMIAEYEKATGNILEPEENVWLWGDGDTVLWGDGTNVLTE